MKIYNAILTFGTTVGALSFAHSLGGWELFGLVLCCLGFICNVTNEAIARFK